MTPELPIPLPHISGPANAALAVAGITTLNELATHTQREIANLHGMGPKGLRILDEAMVRHDLTYAGRAATTEENTSS